MSLKVFLLPVIFLLGWTFVIWAWMYLTRIPAILKAKIDVQDASSPRGEWRNKIPEKVNRVADNYNHLHEQPTAFYAVMCVLALMGSASHVALGLAWIYVALRVAHSLAQIVANHVMLRFGLFVIGTLALTALWFIAAYNALAM